MALSCYVICSQVYILTWQLFVFLTTVSVAAVSGFEPDNGKHRSQDSEEAARKYLEKMENEFDKRANRAALARWAYASNITEENLKNQVRKCENLTVMCCSYVAVHVSVYTVQVTVFILLKRLQSTQHIQHQI